MHPKNKADRRRINKKHKFDPDREEATRQRIAKEALETKEALDVLRRQVPKQDED